MDFYDLNASQLAEEINVGRSSISHIISGRNKPSLDFIMSVVKRFDEVDLYWLVNGQGSFPNGTAGGTSAPPLPSNSEGQASIDHYKVAKPTPNNTTEIKPATQNQSDAQRKVNKVIILYDDGSFEEFAKMP